MPIHGPNRLEARSSVTSWLQRTYHDHATEISLAVFLGVAAATGTLIGSLIPPSAGWWDVVTAGFAAQTALALLPDPRGPIERQARAHNDRVMARRLAVASIVLGVGVSLLGWAFPHAAIDLLPVPLRHKDVADWLGIVLPALGGLTAGCGLATGAHEALLQLRRGGGTDLCR